MDEIFLIIREEGGIEPEFTYRKDLVGIYKTEEEAMADVDRLVKETLDSEFTEEEAKKYKVSTDIKELNDGEEFWIHENDGFYNVAQISAEDHWFDFPLFRLDVPFKDRFSLDHLEVVFD